MEEETVTIDLDLSVLEEAAIKVRPVPVGLYPTLIVTLGARDAGDGVIAVDVVAGGGPRSFEEVAIVLETIARACREGEGK